MSNHKLCYTIMCNVYKLSTCSSCRQSRWSSLYQCLTFSAFWFIRYIKFTLSDKMSSNYHCWRNWDYQVYFNVCRLAFVDCWIWINCDVTATDHSFSPAHPMLLAQWFVPLVAGPVQPCGELISHPPCLYLTHGLLKKPYSDWCLVTL